MRKVSWLVAGISLLLSVALLSCGYAKRDEVEKELTDQKMDLDQKIQLAQDAAAAASDKADAALVTAKEEIGKAKEEVIATAEEKDAETLAVAKSSIEAGDAAVKTAAEEAASKALADSKAAAMAEDEKVKQAAEEAELAKELPKPKESIVFTVYFALGQTKINDDGKAELERAANAIEAHPSAVVRIEGHTDNIPVIRSTKYMNNWGLSQARAQAVKNHLVETLGVSAESIKEAIGVAFYKPVAPNDSKSRHLNRRVEVILMPQD